MVVTASSSTAELRGGVHSEFAVNVVGWLLRLTCLGYGEG